MTTTDSARTFRHVCDHLSVIVVFLQPGAGYWKLIFGAQHARFYIITVTYLILQCHEVRSSLFVAGLRAVAFFYNTSELLSEMPLVVFPPVDATVTTTADPHASVYVVAKDSDVDSKGMPRGRALERGERKSRRGPGRMGAT